MTGYLLLVLAAVIAGIALGGLIILAGSCSEEARSRKLGAGCAPSSYGDTGATAMAGADSLSAVTGDDPVLCHLCGHDTSLAMIAHHLAIEHGIDPDDIANASIVEGV